jgi:hypothetical protein
MNPPSDLDLPFFAYGLFKPDQLGYLRITDLVEKAATNARTRGHLLVRDGLPILDQEAEGTVPGALISFVPGRELEAYMRIAEVEPDNQYYWGTVSVTRSGVRTNANVLLGRSPQKGTVALEGPDWDGRGDPLFTVALEVVQETLDCNRQFDWNLKPLFRLEQAYLLLWSSIERYTSLRYSLGDNATAKVLRMSEEPAFAAALREVVNEQRTVYRADKPEEKLTLAPDRPKKALAYYYQIRNNVVHRGKAVVYDFDRVLEALDQLLVIFRRVLHAAFDGFGKGSKEQGSKVKRKDQREQGSKVKRADPGRE